MNMSDRKKAFTLIELIVSMSIIAILSTLFLVNYRPSNQRTDLTMAAQVMASDIRFAQSNTLGLIGYNGAMPDGGWGVSFSASEGENDRYIIFADMNDNRLYDEGEAEVNFGGKIVTLPKNISIDDFILENSSSTNLDITFLPPDPITRIYDGANEKIKVQIILKESLNNNIKNVMVNFAGLVDVYDAIN